MSTPRITGGSRIGRYHQRTTSEPTIAFERAPVLGGNRRIDHAGRARAWRAFALLLAVFWLALAALLVWQAMA